MFVNSFSPREVTNVDATKKPHRRQIWAPNGAAMTPLYRITPTPDYVGRMDIVPRRPRAARMVAVWLLAIAISGWCAAELWMAISPGGAP